MTENTLTATQARTRARAQASTPAQVPVDHGEAASERGEQATPWRVPSARISWIIAPLCLLAFLLPFETREGWFRLGPLTVTNLEALLWIYLLASWIRHWLRQRLRPRSALRPAPGPGRWRLPSTGRRVPIEAWAAGAWIAVLFAASLQAPSGVGHALKFTGRLALGPLLFWTVRRDLIDPAARLTVACVLVGSASIAATLGLLEVHRLVDLSALFSPFRHKITTSGGELRLTSSFQHANTAAGAFELLLPLSLGLAAVSFFVRTRLDNHAPHTFLSGARLRIAAGLCGALLFWALLLTLSRAGMIAGGGAALLTGTALALTLPRAHGRRVLVLTAAVLAVPASLTLLTAPALRGRMAAQTRPAFGVVYEVDSLATFPRAQHVSVPIVLRNTGTLVWRHRGAQPVHLSYHWAGPEGMVTDFEGARTVLPRDVGPDESITLHADVWTPEELGEYLLLWDLVQEHVTWFSQRGNPSAKTFARVLRPEEVRPRPSELAPWARAQSAETLPWIEYPILPRRTLWGIAAGMVQRHPLLGIGPDRFRFSYASFLPAGSFDPRLHCNNLYLELGATSGLLGLLAFLGFMALLGRRFVLQLRGGARRARAERQAWAIAGLGILAAFLAHGLLDSFLEPFAVMGTFWLGLGIAASAISEEIP